MVLQCNYTGNTDRSYYYTLYVLRTYYNRYLGIYITADTMQYNE